ncbi:MAG: phospho-N-acetylmuramoyl-pentapeptide-transferase [Lachnospiraceae bacterium]|nr:phospho-N-acetylmuramoyl-pentapeptide-transferase [Lachnospiraceae bacterium]
MDQSVFIPFAISFFITILLGPKVIPFLHKLKFGQTVRDEGPESHKAKTGTPTMGGLIFLTGVLVASLVYVGRFPATLPVMLLTFGFGIVGFLDDYIKVVKKRSMGLRAWQKMGLQLLITTLFALYITKVLGLSLAMKIPFAQGIYLDLGWFNIPLIYLVVIGTDTGSNFTDGVDGLASSVTAVMAVFFAVASIALSGGVTPVSMAFIGGLLGFLVFNAHPAKVFMGDTGALALGGFVAAVAYIMQLQLFLVIIGIIYVVEVLSVMIQVSYFKLTHGKRIFRMSPIHHHFELGGWSETKVVAVFTIVTALACFIAFDGLW